MLTTDQTAYWDSVAEQKNFSHPLNEDWLRTYFNPESNILDYGCGYGRVCHELTESGYTNIIGVDPSATMIARGKRLFPNLDLRATAEFELQKFQHHFDGVTLFAPCYRNIVPIGTQNFHVYCVIVMLLL